MWDWTGIVWDWMQGVLSTIWSWLVWLYENVARFIGWTIAVFRNAFGWIGTGFRWVIRHLEALRHLDFKHTWEKIKAGYKRLRGWMDWYQRTVQGPIDKIRQRIMDIYRTFFQPIIRFLDSLRVFTRFIALFNRKLAAKLDARLWGLESKIMWPITAALKRINSMSSQIRAYFTALGMLDRVLLLESMRRDALLVWEVLTNPRGRIYAPSPPLGTYTYSDLHQDVQVYSKTQGGPIADYIDAAHRSVREDLLGVI